MNSYEFFIGLRYTRSRQRTRFISVISLISVIGIALGMTVLITVLSVMNGFQREVRKTMLSAVAHVQISGMDDKLSDWEKIAAIAKGLLLGSVVKYRNRYRPPWAIKAK